MRNGIASMTAALAGAVWATGAPGQIEMETALQSGQPAPVGEPGVVFSSFIGGPLLASETEDLLVRARLGGETVDSMNNVGLFLVSQGGGVSLVAREGDPAPGLPPNVRYANLDVSFLPAFNSHGEVVFGAQLAGDGLVNGEDLSILLGMWGACPFPCRADLVRDGVVDGADLSALLSRWGMCPTPCLADLTDDAVSDSDDTAVFAGRPGDIQLMMREGDEAPGASVPGTRITGFNEVLLNNNGTIGVRALAQTPPFPEGLELTGGVGYLFRDGSPILVAGPEEPAPEFGSTAIFVTAGALSLNSSDRFSYLAAVADSETGSIVNIGLWDGALDGSGVSEFILGSGDPAPGTEEGTVFASPEAIPLQGTGQDILFRSLLQGPLVSLSNNIGVWRHSAGETTLVIRLDDPAPEFGEGVVFTGMTNPIGDATRISVMRVGFVGPGVNTTNDLALLAIEPDNSRRVVARTGDQAPGAAPGQVWVNFPFPPTVDAMGRAAFIGELTGPGVTSLNREGVWVVDRDGAGRLIVRQGDIVEAAPGDQREVFTISALLSNDVDTGEPRGFEDNTLVMRLIFTDLTSAMMRVTLPAQIVPADLNADGAVDGADLGALLGAWGPCEGACEADLNSDGVVDGADLGALLGAWSGSQPAPSM